MPRPTSSNGAHVVQAVWDLFYATNRWPNVGELARQLDRRHDLLLEDALAGVPLELMFGIDPRFGLSDQATVGLTLAGVAAATGSHEELDAFVATVRLAAEIDQEWDALADRLEAQPTLTSAKVIHAVPLPAAGRSELLGRVGALLLTENWGWSGASGEAGAAEWHFTIDRRVRRFRGVVDIADYWTRAHPTPPPQPSSAPAAVPQTEDAMDHEKRELTVNPTETPQEARDRTVFLVHGRDHGARDALIELLHAFDLKVVSWRQAATRAGGGTPYTGDIVRAGMEMAAAVVVLLTPDDVGFVRRAFRQDRDGPDDLRPTGQARLNVIFEAGMAMARDRDRVVLVEVGVTRGLSDTAGLNVIRLDDGVESRKDLAARLRAAGLAVDTDDEQWRTVAHFEALPLTQTDLALAQAEEHGDNRGSEAEYAVLRFVAAHFDAPGAHRLDTPFEVPGQDWPRTSVVLRDLFRSTPPYIEGIEAAEADYPIVITRLTERGRRAARAQPA